MFERNAVDRGSDSLKKTHAVELAMSNGHSISGVFHVAATRTLEEELNAGGNFIDFEPHNGERSFISKSSICQIKRVNVPAANQLDHNGRNWDASDPYVMLGLTRGEGQAAVHTAYRNLAKVYHPDRFAGLDMPEEMITYVSAMARRINVAFGMLQVTEAQEEARVAQEAERAGAPKTPFEEFRASAEARYR